MNNIFKQLTQKNLKVIALAIWLLLGASLIARDLSGHNVFAEFGKNFKLFNIFFDTARSEMNKDWEDFEREMREFQERFDKESAEYSKQHKKLFDDGMAGAGLHDIGGKLIEEDFMVKKPPVKSTTVIQKEWESDIFACSDKFDAKGDNYVKCLEERAKAASKNNS